MAKRKADTTENAEATTESAEPQLMVSPRDTPAPEGASLDGLDDAQEIEIVHPETKQTYGVTVAAYRDLYEPLGYKPTRQADNTLLPGDPRAPEADTVPADAPAPVVPTPDNSEALEGADGEGEGAGTNQEG